MKEAAYWIALAHLPRWGYARINNLIVNFFHKRKISIEEFFHLTENEWRREYELDDKQVLDLKQAKSELPGNAFLAESFLGQGYEIIPITSPDYSRTLKNNLKATHSPAVLYIKGNRKLLAEKSIAVVGSRDASDIALAFTDNIAKIASRDSKVVVSGFARGVDKQALDSAISCKGQSIIVLPQGIMTFNSGFKNYYKQIIEGDVLVLSTFFPKAAWKVDLAMSRNPIIYGLADEVYIAESSAKGGTWSGAIDGLKKGRNIKVRNPSFNERNANATLIGMGAIPVDFNGNEIGDIYAGSNVEDLPMVRECEANEVVLLENRIRVVFEGGPLSNKELMAKLGLNWTTQKLSGYLKKLDFIEVIKSGNKNLYRLKDADKTTQTTLFD